LTPFDRPAAAILAGGRAARMSGADKSALVIGGRTVLARQRRALNTVASPVIVVAKRAGRFRDAHVVLDSTPASGALVGLCGALAASPAEWTIVLACDLPFVQTPLLARLVERREGVDAVVPRARDGVHPLCALYRRSCLPAFRRRLCAGDLRVVAALDDVRVRWIEHDEIEEVDPGGLSFVNINTLEELAQAESRAHAESL
jgi:molybdopterin-guanine dinucleotide biosynthesis protein A